MHGSQAGGGEVGGGVLGEAGGEVGGAEAGDADGVWRGATEAEPPGAWRGVLDVDDLHVLDAQQFLHARGLRASRAWMWTRGHHTELTTTTTSAATKQQQKQQQQQQHQQAPSRQRSACVSCLDVDTWSPHKVNNDNNNNNNSNINSSLTTEDSVRLVPECGHVVTTQS